TGADAAAIRRVAEVAAGIDLRIETAARARDALQHVGDRREAGLLDRCLVEEYHRRILVEGIAANARAGDDDLARWRRLGRLSRRGLHVRRRQRALSLRCSCTRRKSRESDARSKYRIDPFHHSPCSPWRWPAPGV